MTSPVPFVFKHRVCDLLGDSKLQPSLPSMRTERATCKVARVESLIKNRRNLVIYPQSIQAYFYKNHLKFWNYLNCLNLKSHGQAKRDWLKNDKTSKSIKIIPTTTPRAAFNPTLSRPHIALDCCASTFHRWQNIFQLEPTGIQEPLTGMATS